MKSKILILIVFLFFVDCVFSQAKSKEKFIPPGTVKVNDSLFYDITETTNFNWLKYNEWLKDKYGIDSDIYIKSLSDTLIWREKLFYGEPFIDYYHIHPAYRDYPVVGVSFEQASAYCLWRTERVKETLLELRNKKPKTYIPTKFVYRLPTITEWEAEAKVDYSEKTKQEFENKDISLYNLKKTDSIFSPNKKYYSSENMTTPVISYWSNKHGVYNLMGNVAEITSEKGIAKGGSWKHLIDDVKIETEFKYVDSANWLGFRCVCEIIKY